MGIFLNQVIQFYLNNRLNFRITRNSVEVKDEDLWSYSCKNCISLRNCPYDHWLTDKSYLSDVTVTNISESFTHKMAVKTS